MSLGNGAIQSVSCKQKISTRSSTEAELVSCNERLDVDKLFRRSSRLRSDGNVVFRDNQSSMKIETNGKASSGKRTRLFKIKYFLITDLTPGMR